MIALSARGSMVDADAQPRAARARPAVSETGPADAPKPLLDRVREAIRARHSSHRTEETYVDGHKQRRGAAPFGASGHIRSHLQPVIRDVSP